MKKFLSLVLALVMVMSLVTVSAGAKDFTDDDKITYEEAVAVISEIGVVDGDKDGSFRPTDTLTRQAAAKIICNLILGPTTAAELHADTAPYKDVAVNNQFAGYIAYCQSRGIISGYADGSFRPTGTLTGYAFMKMLLGALGYDSSLEGYVGSNWSINVAKQALGIGLDNGIELKDDAVFNGIKAVTREEACLYAFNTLQADLVEYGQRLTTNVNGTEVTLSSGGATSRTWNSQQSRYDNIRVDNLVQFAEEYFNKLEKKADTDDFERPAHTWLYDKVKIGTYVNWELLVERYTSGVTGRDLYDLLNSTIIRDNDLVYYVNGLVPGGSNPTATNPAARVDGGQNIEKKDLIRSNQKDEGITGDGVLTEVFLDKDAELITIVSVNTWLAKASGDYNETKEYAPLVVYFALDSKDRVTTKTWNVDVEDVKSIVDVKEDDFRLVNITYKNNASGDVVALAEPEVMENSAVTKFSQTQPVNGAGKVTKLTTGGTEYKAAQKAFYDDEVLSDYDQSLLTNKTYTIFMDPYGYFIGVELYEGVKNYVFITGFDRPQSNLSISTAQASGIFLDGTMEVLTVNVSATDDNIDAAWSRMGRDADYKNENAPDYFMKWKDVSNLRNTTGEDGHFRYNRWFTYSKNEAGVYTLNPATRMTVEDYSADATIRTDSVYVTDNVMKKGDNAYGANQSPYNNVAGSYTRAYQYTRDWTARSYGNDNSVFITVDMDRVDTNSDETAITGVNGIYTGVQNVEIEIKDTIAKEAEIYTVYDRNYYIVGAVVVGEAKGANASIAYVLSYAKSEARENDTYFWDFDCIHEGEIKTLTIKSKHDLFRNMINTENTGRGASGNGKADNRLDGIVELRFDSDGYVVNVKQIDEAKVYSNYGSRTSGFKGTWSGGVLGTDVLKLSEAKVYRMNVIHQDWNSAYGPGAADRNKDSVPDELTLKGRTLYVTSDQEDEGLALAAGAKAVVIQTENNKADVKTQFATVEGAYAHLADRDPITPGLQYNGEVVAALNSAGAAEWVLFYNYTPLVSGNVPGYGGSTADCYVNTNNPAQVKVIYNGAENKPTEAQALDMVIEELAKKGTLVGDVAFDGVTGCYKIVVSREVGNHTIPTTYLWDPTDIVEGIAAMKVNGVDVVFEEDSGVGAGDTTIAQAMSQLGLASGTYYKVGNTWMAATTKISTIEAGSTIEGGYVKVSISEALDASMDATGFYNSGNAAGAKITVKGDTATTYPGMGGSVTEDVMLVKSGSTVSVAVTVGERNTTGVLANDFVLVLTSGGTKVTEQDVLKSRAKTGSVINVSIKAAGDVTIDGLKLNNKT